MPQSIGCVLLGFALISAELILASGFYCRAMDGF